MAPNRMARDFLMASSLRRRGRRAENKKGQTEGHCHRPSVVHFRQLFQRARIARARFIDAGLQDSHRAASPTLPSGRAIYCNDGCDRSVTQRAVGGRGWYRCDCAPLRRPRSCRGVAPERGLARIAQVYAVPYPRSGKTDTLATQTGPNEDRLSAS